MSFRDAGLCTACCCCPASPRSGGNYNFPPSLHTGILTVLRFLLFLMLIFCPSVPSLVLRLLEHQLQTQRRTYDNEVESMRGELQNVKEENNRQQQLLAQNLQLPPEARIEASLQHEITRLTNENLVRYNTHTLAHRCMLAEKSLEVKMILLCVFMKYGERGWKKGSS